MIVVPLLLLLVSATTFADCARILAIVVVPLASHQNAHHRLWQELSKRGHDVTLFVPKPRNDPAYPNLTEIGMPDAYNIMEKYGFDRTVAENDLSQMPKICRALTDYYVSHHEVQRIIREEKGKYDVFIVEGYFTDLLMIGKQLNVPVVTVTSTDSMHHEYIGNPAHPLIYSPMIGGTSGPTTLIDRLKTFWNALAKNPIVIDMRLDEDTFRKYFGSEESYDVYDVANIADINLINIHPVFLDRRPLAPNTIVVGGGNHLTPPKPLPEDIRKFMDRAKNGVIYVAFGSSVNTKHLPREKVNTMLTVFKELPYNIIWKFNEKDLPETKPDNVLTLTWAPQQDILRNNKTKLYVTHGGLQSLEEALCMNVPMVIMPFHGDQTYNALRLKRRGLVKMVQHRPTLDKETFKNAILETLDNNELYRKKIKEHVDLFAEQPVPGMDLAIWWIEYVIRHKGAKHLKVPRLPTYQYYFVDVIVFLVTVLTVVLSMIYLCIRRCLKTSKGHVNSHKNDKRKTKRN